MYSAGFGYIKSGNATIIVVINKRKKSVVRMLRKDVTWIWDRASHIVIRYRYHRRAACKVPAGGGRRGYAVCAARINFFRPKWRRCARGRCGRGALNYRHGHSPINVSTRITAVLRAGGEASLRKAVGQSVEEYARGSCPTRC